MMRPEVLPFLGLAVGVGALIAGLGRLLVPRRKQGFAWVGVVVALVFSCYFLWFFRDPPRRPPADPLLVVAGAEGHIAGIKTLTAAEFEKIAAFNGVEGKDLDAFTATNVLRISIFLSLFDVHVNRAPIAGEARFLGYYPGQHVFTFKEKSSEVNQHNSIIITGDRTCCLVNQIVGPVARRVVYWLPKDKPAQVKRGDRFGMMKFGSRLDMYFPADDVTVLVKEGDFVRAGQTVVAKENVEANL